MSYNLFIDDERYPSEHSTRDFVIVRNSDDAIITMKEYGCPEFISFDHDLGGDDTSMIIVNWMIAMDLDRRTYGLENGFFIPDNFEFDVHSQNPVGAKNIKELLNSYLTFRKADGNLCI